MAAAQPHLLGARQAETLTAIAAERTNLSVAWNWMVDHHLLDRIAMALDGVALYYALYQLPAQGRQLLEALENSLRRRPAGSGAAEVLLGRVLGRQARFWLMLGQPERSETCLHQARDVLARHNAEHHLAFGLDIQGRIASLRGDFIEARRLHRLALEEAKGSANAYAETTALNRLAGIAFDTGDFHGAHDYFSRALQLRRENNDWEGVAREIGNLGEVACETGDFEAALSYMEESMAIYRELGIPVQPSRMEGLGRTALRQGRLDEADRWLARAEDHERNRSNNAASAVALLRRTEVALLRDDFQTAERLLALSRARFESSGHSPRISEWELVRAQLALALNQPHEAGTHAREAIMRAEELGDVLVQARGIGMLARASMVLACGAEAMTRFRDALRLIEATGATPVVIDLTAGLLCARLATDAGGDGPNEDVSYGQALADLDFLQTQPETWYATKLDIKRTLSEIASDLDTCIAGTIQISTEALTLEAILDRIR